MPDRVVYFNGEFIPEREARSPIFAEWDPDPNWAEVLSWTPAEIGE